MSENQTTSYIVLGVIGVLIVGFLGWVSMSSEPETPAMVSESVSITKKSPVDKMAPVNAELESIIEEKSGPETSAFSLPSLDESDQLIKERLANLTNNTAIAQWLVPGELIRRFVVLVDNVGQGSIPRKYVGFLSPKGKFSVKKDGYNQYLLNENSYRRYDLLTNVFISVDTQRAVEFYQLILPLFQKAYEELGHQNRSFEAALNATVARLLGTPILNKPVRLIRPVVVYKFADPAIEALTQSEKQLIRTGPKNTRLIQAKLREFVVELKKI
jgi:hypothetical protein